MPGAVAAVLAAVPPWASATPAPATNPPGPLNSPWAGFVLALAGAGVFNVLVEVYKAHRASRKDDVEIATATANAPLVQESLALGNVEKAIAIQQKILEQQQAHITFQDHEIEELRSTISERNGRITELVREIEELRTKVDEVYDSASRVAGDRRRRDGTAGPAGPAGTS